MDEYQLIDDLAAKVHFMYVDCYRFTKIDLDVSPEDEERLGNEIYKVCLDIIDEKIINKEDFKDSQVSDNLEHLLVYVYDKFNNIDKNLIKMYFREIFGKEIYEKS